MNVTNLPWFHLRIQSYYGANNRKIKDFFDPFDKAGPNPMIIIMDTDCSLSFFPSKISCWSTLVCLSSNFTWCRIAKAPILANSKFNIDSYPKRPGWEEFKNSNMNSIHVKAIIILIVYIDWKQLQYISVQTFFFEFHSYLFVFCLSLKCPYMIFVSVCKATNSMLFILSNVSNYVSRIFWCILEEREIVWKGIDTNIGSTYFL